MSQLRIRPHYPPQADGTVLTITPQSAGWKYVGFKVVKLKGGQHYRHLETQRETCLVLVTGKASIHAGEHHFNDIGGRTSPFEDRAPGAVYVPANIEYTVTAHDDTELAICSAPGKPGRQPRLIDESDMPRETRGRGTNTRHVRNILPESKPADSLLVVEVITPGGHWSSYPPHKHDTDTPGAETLLEETYYHRIHPEQGFAFQRVYTDDRSLDETLTFENGDVVLAPRGYHPVAAPHGYDVYYLNVMAGPQRRWLFKNDPAHEWIINADANKTI